MKADYHKPESVSEGVWDMKFKGTVSITDDGVFTPDEYSEGPVVSMWLHFTEPVDMKQVLLLFHQNGYPLKAFSGTNNVTETEGVE